MGFGKVARKITGTVGNDFYSGHEVSLFNTGEVEDDLALTTLARVNSAVFKPSAKEMTGRRPAGSTRRRWLAQPRL
jgi:hypothetical protein